MAQPAQDPKHQAGAQPAKINASIGAEVAATVTISTASILVTHPDDPYKVLVAMNEKHNKPVIIGGKVEAGGYPELEQIIDPDGYLPASERLALATAYQEGWEEAVADSVKAQGEEAILQQLQDMWIEPPRLIGEANDPQRDVRIVPVSKIRSALIDPPLDQIELPEQNADEAMIAAHYGTPDSLYVAIMNPELLGATEEMEGLQYIDIRELEVGGLGAGHDVFALRYREMLDAEAEVLAEDALVDFEAARKEFLNS